MKRIRIWLMAVFTFFIMQNVYADSIKKDFDLETGLGIVQDVERSKNGYIYVAGESNDGYFMAEKYNSDRTLIWSKEITDYEAAVSMTIDEDDNVYAIYINHYLTYTDPSTNVLFKCNQNKTFLVKLDNNGNLVYHKPLDDNEVNITNASVIRYRNNKLYILSNNLDNIRTQNYTNGSIERVTDAKDYTYIYDKNGTLLNKVVINDDGEYIEKVQVRNGQESICGDFWGLTRENNYLFTDDGVFLTVSTGDLTFRYAKLNYENQLSWSKKVFKDEEKFLFGSARDLTQANDDNIIVAGATADEYEDITDEVSQWWPEDEEIPEYLCYEPTYLPSFIKIDRNGNVLERITIQDQGGWVFNIRNQDNGYYAALYLQSLNVEDIENDDYGYYLIRYDYNFNIKDVIKLGNLTFSTNDIDNGIFIFNYETVSRYYVEESEDFEENKSIFMSKIDNYINGIFDNLTEEQVKTINWIVEDKEIAQVKDGTIIPLKEGSTNIIGVYKRQDYVIHLRVTDDLLPNPLTINNFILFLLAFAICGLFMGMYYIRIKIKTRKNRF